MTGADGKAPPTESWTGWRGPRRDGHVAWIPEKLPAKPHVVWSQPLESKGLGGVAATAEHVLVSDREALDSTDTYKCLRASDGKELWAVRNLAVGELDYGNSSRATPLIWKDRVFFFSAFGQLQCAELATGKILWDLDTREKFGAKDERKWGLCSSPLLVDDRLILNPGAEKAALVALDPRTGKVLWQSPGKPASYGSFLGGTFGGIAQVIGWDKDSLGGWEVATGKRLWTFKPERRSDFNVPTPLAVGDNLFVAIENNGAYLFRFKDKGVLDPTSVGHYDRLAPDTHTPTLAGKRIFGVWNGLHVLDVTNKLKPIYTSDDEAFFAYTTLVANENRVLAITLKSELILLDARADQLKRLGQLKLLDDEQGCFSHPAFVGTRMYLRGINSIRCIDLAK